MFKLTSMIKSGSLLLLAGSLSLSSCKKSEDDSSPADNSKGYLYTISNASSSNVLSQYKIKDNGTLEFKKSIGSGGTGVDSSLHSQGAVVLSTDKKFVFVVNAGDNSISSYKLSSGELSLVGKYSLTGVRPISVTERAHTVYVLNSSGLLGAVASIEGFTVNAETGVLSAISGSSTSLPANCDPAQIALVYDDVLVVSERATNLLSSYKLSSSKVPGTRQTKAVQDQTPYGFAVSSTGKIFVTEASANSSVSSYAVSTTGAITNISTVKDNQAAACWAVLSADESVVYAANTSSNSISPVSISSSGSLTNTTAVNIGAGNGPLDLGINRSGEYLYVINGTTNKIKAYKISGTTLTAIADVSVDIPTAGLGIAVY